MEFFLEALGGGIGLLLLSMMVVSVPVLFIAPIGLIVSVVYWRKNLVTNAELRLKGRYPFTDHSEVRRMKARSKWFVLG